MNTTARELLQDQQLIWIRPNDLVDQALQKMAKNDISALPIIDAPENASTGPIKGFVDVVDLVAFLASVGTRPLTDPYGAGESRSLMTDDFGMLHRRSRSFRIANTLEVSDLGKRNPLHKVSQNMTVKDLIQFFGKSNESVHRVAVVDDNHNLIGVLTQSMLICSINNYLGDRPEIRGINASALQMTPIDKLSSVNLNTPAYDAFIKMHLEGLSSLAVVSDRGDICENISATDLKGALTDFKLLCHPISEYLPKTRNFVLGKKRREGLVQCGPQESLNVLVNLVSGSGVHRVYVTDEQRKPIGVVSLTDICRTLSGVLA